MALRRNQLFLLVIKTKRCRKGWLLTLDILWSVVKLALHKGLEMYLSQMSVISCCN